MKADGWLVEEEIKTGRFRRGRGLTVDWASTPWPHTGNQAGAAAPLPNEDDPQAHVDQDSGQSVNEVVND
jgi:hypothetical protein